MYACASRVCSTLGGQKKGYCGPGVTDGCEPPCGTGIDPRFSARAASPLTADPSLQPLSYNLNM